MEQSHKQGLSACRGLKRLTVNQSVLCDRHSNIQFGGTAVPTNISFLTGLDELNLDFTNFYDSDLGWISQLVSLKALEVNPASFDCSLLQHFSTLTNLRRLKVSTKCLLSSETLTCISLDVDWQHMSSLEVLYINGVRAQFGSQTLRLLQLRYLTDVTLNLIPDDSQDVAVFADLLYQFGISRQDVRLNVINRQLPALD